MKKKALMIVTITAVMIGGGLFGVWQFTASPASASISEQEALEKAKSQFPGEVVEIELGEQGSTPVYELEIEGPDRNYELHLDGTTGEIIQLEEKERQTAVPQAPATANTDDLAGEDNADDRQSEAARETGDEDDQDDVDQLEEPAAATTPISNEKAREIAQKEVNGQIVELELDEDDGLLHYEIEMVTDQNEVSLDIDAYTGKMLAVSYDDLDD